MSTSRKCTTARLLFGLAAALFVLAGIFAAQQIVTTRRANSAAQHAVDLANAGKPSPAPATIKPTQAAVSTYTVAADHPRYLSIAKIGVHARVLPTGLTKDNAIGTPSNVYDTAWYTGSTLPGQAGATLIDGHVSSWTTHGVFYNLHTLAVNDKLQIELGDGTILSYTVVKTQTYDHTAVDVTSLLTSADPTKPGLNVITCSGDVIKGSNEFAERFVVYAVQS